MASLADLLGRIVPPGQDVSALFGILLLLHVGAGLTCVATGAAAAASRKRRGRHPRLGTTYFWGLSVVFVTAAGMSLLRWPEDTQLLVLGTVSFALASLGLAARKTRWPGWRSAHILGMALSYVVLLTAFYVDNGPRLPLWDRLPAIAYWTLPSLVGLPLLVRGLRRHTRLRADLRGARTALSAFLTCL